MVPLGDLAAYVEFSRTLDLEVNEWIQRLSAAVRARAVAGLRDVVPALGGLALHFDPSFQGSVLDAAAALVEEVGKKKLPAAEKLGRDVEVPVCYDEEFAPDLAEVASKTKISPEEIKKIHSSCEYRVLMIGFAPGHAYLGGLDRRLAVPRRASPRASVPAGSVAIANEQSVVYPYAISGGWSVIGRTPLVVFDASRSRPSLFSPADRVRFVAIEKKDFLEMAEKQ